MSISLPCSFETESTEPGAQMAAGKHQPSPCIHPIPSPSHISGVTGTHALPFIWILEV